MWCQPCWEGGDGLWSISTISVFCQKDSFQPGMVSAIQKIAINLKSNTSEQEAVLGGESERCYS